jgi:hypothetical protein
MPEQPVTKVYSKIQETVIDSLARGEGSRFPQEPCRFDDESASRGRIDRLS